MRFYKNKLSKRVVTLSDQAYKLLPRLMKENLIVVQYTPITIPNEYISSSTKPSDEAIVDIRPTSSVEVGADGNSEDIARDSRTKRVPTKRATKSRNNGD
jgi:hypothetical protein